ncbi:MAG: hypothetical protein ACPGUV_07285 [Polyangiales bacterium]
MACDENTTTVALTLALVTPAGDAPAELGIPGATLRLQQRSDEATSEQAWTLPGPDFDLRLPLADSTTLQLQAELRGGDIIRVGATPPFALPSAGGFVRLPLTTVGTCTPLTAWTLPAQTEGAATLLMDSFVVGVGGTGDGVPRSTSWTYDRLRLGLADGPEAPLALGPARAVRLDDTRALTLGAQGQALQVQLSHTTPTRFVPLPALYPGAGGATAMRHVPAQGAVLAGGQEGAVAVDSVLWVAVDGSLSPARLSTGRSQASALLVDDGVWLVGGADPAAPLIDVLAVGQARAQALTVAVDARWQQTRALWDAPTRTLVLLRPDASLLLRGCPAACVAETVGPPPASFTDATLWSDGQQHRLVGGSPDSSVLEAQVSATGIDWQLVARLTHARTTPTVHALEAGTLLVLGGSSTAPYAELCATETIP